MMPIAALNIPAAPSRPAPSVGGAAKAVFALPGDEATLLAAAGLQGAAAAGTALPTATATMPVAATVPDILAPSAVPPVDLPAGDAALLTSDAILAHLDAPALPKAEDAGNDPIPSVSPPTEQPIRPVLPGSSALPLVTTVAMLPPLVADVPEEAPVADEPQPPNQVPLPPALPGRTAVLPPAGTRLPRTLSSTPQSEEEKSLSDADMPEHADESAAASAALLVIQTEAPPASNPAPQIRADPIQADQERGDAPKSAAPPAPMEVAINVPVPTTGDAVRTPDQVGPDHASGRDAITSRSVVSPAVHRSGAHLPIMLEARPAEAQLLPVAPKPESPPVARALATTMAATMRPDAAPIPAVQTQQATAPLRSTILGSRPFHSAPVSITVGTPLPVVGSPTDWRSSFSDLPPSTPIAPPISRVDLAAVTLPTAIAGLTSLITPVPISSQPSMTMVAPLNERQRQAAAPVAVTIAPPIDVRASEPLASPTAAPAGLVFGAAIAAAEERDRRSTEPGALVSLDSLAPAVSAPERVTAAPSTQPALDMSDARWPQTMIARIEHLRDAVDAADTRIRLLPDALGAIDVDVRRDGDRLDVRFSAEQPQTRALLQEAQPRLAEAAEARGLRLGQASVDAGASNGNQQRQPTPEPRRAPPPPTINQRERPAETADDARIA